MRNSRWSFYGNSQWIFENNYHGGISLYGDPDETEGVRNESFRWRIDFHKKFLLELIVELPLKLLEKIPVQVIAKIPVELLQKFSVELLWKFQLIKNLPEKNLQEFLLVFLDKFSIQLLSKEIIDVTNPLMNKVTSWDRRISWETMRELWIFSQGNLPEDVSEKIHKRFPKDTHKEFVKESWKIVYEIIPADISVRDSGRLLEEAHEDFWCISWRNAWKNSLRHAPLEEFLKKSCTIPEWTILGKKYLAISEVTPKGTSEGNPAVKLRKENWLISWRNFWRKRRFGRISVAISGKVLEHSAGICSFYLPRAEFWNNFWDNLWRNSWFFSKKSLKKIMNKSWNEFLN